MCCRVLKLKFVLEKISAGNGELNYIIKQKITYQVSVKGSRFVLIGGIPTEFEGRNGCGGVGGGVDNHLPPILSSYCLLDSRRLFILDTKPTNGM